MTVLGKITSQNVYRYEASRSGVRDECCKVEAAVMYNKEEASPVSGGRQTAVFRAGRAEPLRPPGVPSHLPPSQSISIALFQKHAGQDFYRPPLFYYQYCTSNSVAPAICCHGAAVYPWSSLTLAPDVDCEPPRDSVTTDRSCLVSAAPRLQTTCLDSQPF